MSSALVFGGFPRGDYSTQVDATIRIASTVNVGAVAEGLAAEGLAGPFELARAGPLISTFVPETA